MPEPMNDNARIVREVILFREKWFPHPQTEAAIAALTALETELAAAQADLERARESLKPYLRHLGTCGESRWPASKCTCGLSAALAPEQKDQTNKENS